MIETALLVGGLVVVIGLPLLYGMAKDGNERALWTLVAIGCLAFGIARGLVDACQLRAIEEIYQGKNDKHSRGDLDYETEDTATR